MPVWVWVALGLAALGLELVRRDLYLLWAALGLFAAAPVANHPLWAFGVFASTTALGFAVLRPPLWRRLNPPARDPVSRLIGQRGVVLQTVEGLDFSGWVEVDGRRWSAKSWDGRVIAAGTPIEVLAVEGIQLVVHPWQAPLAESQGPSPK
ncbi:MAG: NfeD family protein [Firmicutes bacterium]|nr:NfeD family protein [Bacillota bacterium]